MICIAKNNVMDSLLERADCVSFKLFRNADGSTGCSFEFTRTSMRLNGDDASPEEVAESLRFVQKLASEFHKAGIAAGRSVRFPCGAAGAFTLGA